MGLDFIPLISFVVVTTFTPGPNNISSASLGVLYGYRRALPYLAGIAAGFFFIMLLSALVSSTLLTLMPATEPVFRILGAVYILWLAIGTARASYAFNGSIRPPMGFREGFFLQAVNPKVAVYGLTLYSTFLASIAGSLSGLIVSAVLFASTSFCSISTWALCGAAIRTHLHHPKVRAGINAVLAMLLAYTAVDLSGVAALVK